MSKRGDQDAILERFVGKSHPIMKQLRDEDNFILRELLAVMMERIMDLEYDVRKSK